MPSKKSQEFYSLFKDVELYPAVKINSVLAGIPYSVQLLFFWEN